jgi:hypothetical protein
MRFTAGIVVAVAAFQLAMLRYSWAQNASSSSVFAVRVATDDAEAYGTAVLVGRQDRGTTTTLYLLTSSQLFRSTHSDRIQTAKAVRLELDPTQSVEIEREDVLFIGTGVADLALLRARTSDVAWFTSMPVVYDAPAVGAVFLIAAPAGDGDVTTVVEHVRFESTLLVVGDRPLPNVAGCIGAPAISTDGVFGIVRECAASRPPVITVLSMAQSLIERHIPRPTTSAAPSLPAVASMLTEIAR